MRHLPLAAVLALACLGCGRSPPAPAARVLAKCRLALPRGDYDSVYACVQAHGYEMAWDAGECAVFNDQTRWVCLRPAPAAEASANGAAK